MLLKLFKSNHPYVIFLIPLLGLTLWIPSLFDVSVNIHPVCIENTTFVYNWLMKYISYYPVVPKIIALILLIIESFILIRLNFKFIFIEIKTYLPSVLFIIFSSLFSSYQILHPLLIANLFILFAMDRAFLIDKSRNHFKRYYESGFLLGLGSLFYPNIYVFIFPVWLTLVILRNFNWREWFSSVMGIVTPFVFYLSILFLTDRFDGAILRLLKILTIHIRVYPFSNISLIAIGLILFVIFIATVFTAQIVGVKKISTRKYFTLFFWFMAFILLLFFVHPSMGYELIVPLAIPLSIICSIYYTEIRSKWLGEVIFTLNLLAAFVIIWFQ